MRLVTQSDLEGLSISLMMPCQRHTHCCRPLTSGMSRTHGEDREQHTSPSYEDFGDDYATRRQRSGGGGHGSSRHVQRGSPGPKSTHPHGGGSGARQLLTPASGWQSPQPPLAGGSAAHGSEELPTNVRFINPIFPQPPVSCA